MTSSRRLVSLARIGLPGLVAVLLSACGTVRVDSEVNTFSTLPPRAAPNAPVLAGGYRFEALPSQQADPAALAAVEAIAQQSLQQAGLQRDDANARYSVLVNVRVMLSRRGGWDDTFGWRPWGYGYWPARYGGYYGHYGYPGYGFGRPYGLWDYGPSPLYRHEVQVVLRDLKTQQVVFESNAVHEGLWASSERLLPALMAAALQDFPNPPRGVRRVNVELPGAPQR